MKSLHWHLLFCVALSTVQLRQAYAALILPPGTLAATGDFTTSLGTVQADGHIGGLPIAATTIFDPTFLDLPLSDQDDPLGTARHELFHGIGFAVAYDLFSAHVRTVGTQRRFNQATNGTGNDLAVLTPTSTHLSPGDFTGQGQGGMEIDQTCLLMTPAPRAGCPIPYVVDFRDRDILNAAFNWSGTGGIQINVIFDNSIGGFTPDEMVRINTARANDQSVFGPATGAHVFTWRVEVVPEPSSLTLLGIGTLGLLAVCRLWATKDRL